MLKRLFSSQLRINMVSGVAVTVVNAAVLAVAYPLYLHFLGYEQYGIWLVLSTVLSFAQLGNLGIGPAVTKLVAEEYGRKNLEAVQQYITSAVAILVVSGAGVVALILLLRTPIVSLFKLSPQNAHTVLWLLPYMACLSAYVFVVQAVNAALAGLGRMDLSNYVQTGGRIIAVVVAAVLLFLGRGITSLLIGSTLSYVFVHATSSILVRRIAPIHALRPRNLDLERAKRLIGFGSGIMGGSLVAMLISPFNKVMLSRYAGVASIPIYEIAFQASMEIRGLVEAGLRALVPEVSRIGAAVDERTEARIAGLYGRVVRLLVMAAVPAFGLVMLLASGLFPLWLGERYVPSLPGVFRIMCIGAFINLLGVPAFYTLMGMGRSWCVFTAHLVQGATNVIILFGALAMGGSITVGTVAWSVVISMGAATAYLLWEKNRVFSPNVNTSPVPG